MTEAQNNTCENCTKCTKLPYIIVNILFAILAIIAFFVGKNYDLVFNGGNNDPVVVVTNSGTTNDNKESSNTTEEKPVVKNDIIVKVIGDKRCSDCQTVEITESLKKAPFLAGAIFEEIDFSDEGIKDLIKDNEIKMLPAVLLNTNNISEEQFVQYLVKTPKNLYSLDVGAEFDPFGEICDNKTDDNGDGKIDCDDTTCTKDFKCIKKVAPKDIVIQLINDKRCSECDTTQLLTQLQLTFTGSKIKQIDFSDKGIKDLLKNNEIKMLPAILLNTNGVNDKNLFKALKSTKAGLYTLDIGSTFDPFAEICDNKTDDNGDGKKDCDDITCAKDFKCASKVDRPVADLYIMSYCPYGLQAQKGYLEVMSKLSKVADVNVKFVQYVMHEQKEADENVIQYCIQKEQKDKYLKYLQCFLAEEGKNEACRKEAQVDENKLTTCIDTTKKEYKVDENMKDKTKQFPDFDIDKKEALAAGVEGSPTFVVNGIKLEKVGRNAKAYADAICSTFKVKPKECDEKFQNVNFDPMFGFTSNGSNANSGCSQ